MTATESMHSLLNLKYVGLFDYIEETIFMINLLENYLNNRNQRVVLNGLNSSWKKILAGVPQGSVLGPLLFLIYINDLPHDISSVCKMFADDTSLFSKANVSSISLSDLNYDLETIN